MPSSQGWLVMLGATDCLEKVRSTTCPILIHARLDAFELSKFKIMTDKQLLHLKDKLFSTSEVFQN